MVFTGIIEEMGTVKLVERRQALEMWDGSKAPGFVITIKCEVALKDAYIGCSICVNGTCLTATELSADTFTVNCAPETLNKTNLGDCEVGSLVNLERSMKGDDRNSGHMVQGHVDETGKVLKYTPDGDSLWVRISLSKDLMPYVVPKGYIAVDGTSLTVCDVNQQEGWFTLMLIAHTQKHIVLPKRKVGDRVNLEADCAGKYAAAAAKGLQTRVAAMEQRLARTEMMAMVALAAATVGGLLFFKARGS